MTQTRKVTRALISVYDKTGLTELAQGLIGWLIGVEQHITIEAQEESAVPGGARLGGSRQGCEHASHVPTLQGLGQRQDAQGIDQHLPVVARIVFREQPPRRLQAKAQMLIGREASHRKIGNVAGKSVVLEPLPARLGQ